MAIQRKAEHLNILGYCLGGVLTTLYVATHSDAPLNSVILLATPIDFSHVDLFSSWLDPRYQDIDKLVDTMGNVPAEFVGVGTKLLKPYLSFVGTYQNLWENAEDEKFVIMPGGHIGLVTSRKAVKNLWPKVVDWLAKHSD